MGHRAPLSAIYEIEHVGTGRIYVGSSRDVASRWRKHRSLLARRMHQNDEMQRDYDADKRLLFRVVQQVAPSGLLLAERAWLAQRRERVNVYNTAPVRDLRGIAERLWEMDRARRATPLRPPSTEPR